MSRRSRLRRRRNKRKGGLPSGLNIVQMNAALREREYVHSLKNYYTEKYWTRRLGWMMDVLRESDPGWEAWFDDDENVPPMASFYKICMLVESRLLHLESDVRAEVMQFESHYTAVQQEELYAKMAG